MESIHRYPLGGTVDRRVAEVRVRYACLFTGHVGQDVPRSVGASAVSRFAENLALMVVRLQYPSPPAVFAAPDRAQTCFNISEASACPLGEGAVVAPRGVVNKELVAHLPIIAEVSVCV